MSTKMSSKEMLLGYINTLSEQDCANLYFILHGVMKDARYVYFNSQGEEIEVDETTADMGSFIKLTRNQYGTLMYKYGKEKLVECIKILFIASKDKSRLGEYNRFRHLTGWVEAEYNRLHRYSELHDSGYDESIPPFTQIETKEQAIKWINSLPKANQYDDAYVIYLKNKFNIAKEMLK